MSNSDHLPVIIGGFYRSGTSLLRRLLDSHPSFYCGPELKFFKDFYGDFLSDPLSHARFFSSARTMGLEESELLEIFGRAFIKSHERAAEKYGKKRWADKNPENVLYLEQWNHLLQGQFVFVHMVRNPLDALSSLNEIGFEKAVPKSFEAKIALYENFLTAAADFERGNAEKSLQVRYEDLVEQPDAVMRNLLTSLGEPFDAEIFDLFYRPERLAGIEDPKVHRTRQVHSDGVGRWKTGLGRKQRKLVVKNMKKWFSLFGYSEPS